MKNTSKASKGSPLAQGVGRRKSAVARVWLRRGKGNMVVNNRDYREYFDTEYTRKDAYKAFKAVPVATQYDVQVNVQGGGEMAQADAIKLGMARALVSLDESLRKSLRDQGLLTVDARIKERKKPGQRGARRKFQFVKR